MLLEKLNLEQIQKMKLKPLGRRHFVRIAIEQLEPGEGVRISKEAFTWKGVTPKRFCNEIEKDSNKRFIVSKEMDNTAWVVLREK